MICLPIKSFTSRLQRLIGMKSKAAAAAANEKRSSHILHIVSFTLSLFESASSP
jgi:hypothetical protein